MKNCGTCRYGGAHENGDLFRQCEFPLPASVARRMMTANEGTNCLMWAAREAESLGALPFSGDYETVLAPQGPVAHSIFPDPIPNPFPGTGGHGMSETVAQPPDQSYPGLDAAMGRALRRSHRLVPDPRDAEIARLREVLGQIREMVKFTGEQHAESIARAALKGPTDAG